MLYIRQHAHHVYSQQTRRTICIADCVEGLGVKKLVWQLANKVIQSLCWLVTSSANKDEVVLQCGLVIQVAIDKASKQDHTSSEYLYWNLLFSQISVALNWLVMPEDVSAQRDDRHSWRLSFSQNLGEDCWCPKRGADQFVPVWAWWLI